MQGDAQRAETRSGVCTGDAAPLSDEQEAAFDDLAALLARREEYPMTWRAMYNRCRDTHAAEEADRAAAAEDCGDAFYPREFDHEDYIQWDYQEYCDWRREQIVRIKAQRAVQRPM